MVNGVGRSWKASIVSLSLEFSALWLTSDIKYTDIVF